MLEHADNVRTILVDPHTIVLPNHIRAGMPHLLRNPVNRSHTSRQQLASVGMPTLTRSTITNPSRFQVRFEEPVSHSKVADVRQAALGVQEDEVQLVLADRLVVSLDDIYRVHGLPLPHQSRRRPCR